LPADYPAHIPRIHGQLVDGDAPPVDTIDRDPFPVYNEMPTDEFNQFVHGHT